MRAVRWDEIPDEQVRPGVRRRGFGNEQVLLVMNRCEPGMDLRPHSHDFDQIAMITAGTAIYHVGDAPNEVGPGSVLTGLIKRIVPDATLLNVSDPKTLDATVHALAAGQPA